MSVCRQRFFKVKVEGEQSMSSSFRHVNLEDKEIILIDKAGRGCAEGRDKSARMHLMVWVSLCEVFPAA